ncbi:sucrose-6-phosphate hydrolase [Oenococcus sicerae]|nr:sucrose-6-phosphate hydrolase [Oenococcus sicerae]
MITAEDRKKQFQNMVKNIKDVKPAIISDEEAIANTSPFRQKFHVEPRSGVLNDPNGFVYFDGQYHLCYQWTPLAFHKDPKIWQHGWYHLVSKDLVHWQEIGPAIESDTKYDQYGTYSGSALSVNDQLFIIYTGNTWVDTDTDQWHRVPYQLGAFMDHENHFTKFDHPLLTDSPKGYTGHFRDPKIWQHGSDYYAVLGAQRQDQTGTVVVVHSKDLHHWTTLGEMQPAERNFGHMWECPDYFEVDDQGVLLFSPQGIPAHDGLYENIYQTGCFVGDKMDYHNLIFNHGHFQELDAGFDFYATQTMAAPDGRRILSAWFGISEIAYPTEKYHYAGCLVLPRELSIQDGQLVQKPIRELAALRKEQTKFDFFVSENPVLLAANRTQEIDAEIDMSTSSRFEMDIRANADNDKNTKLVFDKNEQLVSLSRADAGIPFAAKYGSERYRKLMIKDKIRMQIFVDNSSVEIFINGGIIVFSARIFPDNDQDNLFVTSRGGKTKLTASIWKI